VWAGDLAGAEQMARHVLPLAEGGDFAAELWQGPLLSVIRHNKGLIADQLAYVEAFLKTDRPGFRDYAEPLLALASAHAGRHAQAEGTLRHTIQREAVPPNPFWVSGRVMLCEVAEILNDGAAAAVLRNELRPFAGLIAGTFAVAISPVDLALSQAALAAGDLDEAEAVADRAVAASRRRATPLFLGRELLRLAASRRRRGAAAVEVAPLVGEAIAWAERAGADLIRLEAERLDLVVE